ncbi:MAG: HAD-IC family P-type ATPase, partial [Oscillospiraceae bacterium]|nr:HAD-IC family P-type ATPase [Oscillospiraceae bacterium]
LDALADLKTAVFDKTGTLTRGVFEVRAVYPEPGVTRGDLLRLAAHAETYSTHPIATSIEKAYEQESGARVKLAAVTDYAEAAGHGVSARVEGKRTLAGGAALLRRENVAFTERENAGTTVYLARDGAYLGCIVIADETRADARNAVASLAALGVDSVMLTGDSEAAAARVADEVGIAARHASLLPQDKVALVEKFQDAADKRSRKTVAFVGDGINDAPVLARADIGIAMGGLGSDAAIEAADIVLMTDEPSKLPQAVAVARSTRRIVSQNVAFALSVKGVILLLGVFGLASMWLAVFADVGVALLAILNSTRAGRV